MRPVLPVEYTQSLFSLRRTFHKPKNVKRLKE